ncbi:hypothetical protein GCM10027595_11330 [Corynebacterium nasicanis]
MGVNLADRSPLRSSRLVGAQTGGADAHDHEHDYEGQGQEHVPPVLKNPGLFRCRHAPKYVRSGPVVEFSRARSTQPPLSGGETNTRTLRWWNNSWEAGGPCTLRPLPAWKKHAVTHPTRLQEAVDHECTPYGSTRP